MSTYNKIILVLVLMLAASALSFAESKGTPNSWQPSGKTVAGPKEIDPSVQATARSSADAQIPYKYRNDSELRVGDNRGFVYYGIAIGDFRDQRLRGGPITPANLHNHVSYRSDNVRREDVFIYND